MTVAFEIGKGYFLEEMVGLGNVIDLPNGVPLRVGVVHAFIKEIIDPTFNRSRYAAKIEGLSRQVGQGAGVTITLINQDHTNGQRENLEVGAGDRVSPKSLPTLVAIGG